MKYPGGKGKCFQQIINTFPPHTIYIETHLGGGAVMRHKLPADKSIGIDKDPKLIEHWRKHYPTVADYVHGDALDFLTSFQFDGSELIYCDPPYLASTRKRSRVYRYDLSETDHIRLLDALLHLPCFVAISGYWSDVYETKLKNWNVTTFRAKAHDGVREEWLWMNYTQPERLHDTRFFGSDYRKRQDLKRKMLSLRQKIRRLSKPEQHQLHDWIADLLVVEEENDADVRLPCR